MSMGGNLSAIERTEKVEKMYTLSENGNRDLLKPPKDLIDVTVGSGRWQILVTLMLSFIVLIHLLNTGNETLLRPPGWWCKMPDFLEDWTDVQWILYSHYKDSYKRGCSNGTILSSLWLSSSTFGRIAGYIVFGTLSDWIGRRSVILIACGSTPFTALVVAISSDYPMFVVASVVHGFFHGGLAICMILVLEISTNSWRTGLMAISCGSFAIGIGLTPIINSVFDSYDQMIIFINLLCVVMFVSTRFLPESPAWLLSIRDGNRLEITLGKAAEVNQRQFKSRLIYTDDERHRLPERMPRLWDLMLQPQVACRVIGIVYLTGLFGVIFGAGYYAVLSNVAKSQLANTLLAASTTIGMLIGQLCTLLMGHGRILRVSISLVLLTSFVLIVRLDDLRASVIGPTTTLLLLNVSIISLSYGVLLNYNTRTFPTLLRGTICGIFHSTWATLVWAGNHDYVKFPRMTIILVISCVIAALFSLNFPELDQRELPDTMADCASFKVQPKPRRWEIIEIIEDFASGEMSYVSIERPSKYLDCVGNFPSNIPGERNLSRDRPTTRTAA